MARMTIKYLHASFQFPVKFENRPWKTELKTHQNKIV